MDNIVEQLCNLLNMGKFSEARKLVTDQLENLPKMDHEEAFLVQIQLYGFLIDIGCACQNKEDLEKAVHFMVENEEAIRALITQSSYCYNLANAKHGLCEIFYSQNRGVHPISVCREKFQEPIDLYWLAFKYYGADVAFRHKLLVNLANALIYNFRIVEAIQMLDMVLREDPYHPQALVSRGDHLFHLIINSPVTVALYAQIYLSYSRGIETGNLPPLVLEKSRQGQADALTVIQAQNISMNDLENEIQASQQEYEQHTAYRKFCIDNFLTLNEHSIYCNCLATSKDILQIGIPNAVFKGKLLPKLELLLNRIKSEYAFARWNYYKSFTEDAFDYDVVFSELFEQEVINSQSEALRASFRICYGILDKIALGICKMYGIEGRNIYFERFWEDKQRKDVLEQKRNIHLNALSSIANDLNGSRGELKHFKNWRNKLEHNLLILQKKSNLFTDVYQVLQDEEFVVAVDIDDFREKTIHLLQLTRAAIFSFVYCIRLETITDHEPDDTFPNFTISPKT